jgi:hypothetical protein
MGLQGSLMNFSKENWDAILVTSIMLAWQAFDRYDKKL